MIDTAQEYEQQLLKHEILKVYNSREISNTHKIEVLLLRWKENNTITLECRNLYLNKAKSKWWKMGKRAAIGMEELTTIEKNIVEIKQYLRGSST